MSDIDNIKTLQQHIAKLIIGQEYLVNRLLIALLADGHLLVEGAPGLAKTRAIKSLAAGVEADFQRIQFTPDLLPADLTGTDIYRQESGNFEFQRGPLFHNLILADEVNRAPAKVQSALLEAMGEHQITVANTTYQLPDLFLVMATQNPIEQEGTYPLPEAQLDRFLMYVQVTYPTIAEEKEILRLVRAESQAGNSFASSPSKACISQAALFSCRRAILDVYMADNIEEYLLQLVVATRSHQHSFSKWIQYGVSPRASIALDRCARAHAFLAKRDYVGPEDIQAVLYDVLRHRIILSYEAEAHGIDINALISELLATVPVP